jgi:hypothetical protein
LLAFALVGTDVHAQRAFPQDTWSGDLEGIVVPHIRISGQTYRLAPGSKFRDLDNRIVMPVSAPQSGRIGFNFDQLGQVWGIWLLNAQEAERLKGRDIKSARK